MLAAISYTPIVTVPVGPLDISPHAVGIAAGFLLATQLMLRTGAERGISEDAVYDVLLRSVIGSLVGARVAYVVNHLGEYESVVDVFKVWEGGISLLGGIFGAILLCIPLVRRRRLSLWKTLDAVAAPLALGIIIGRIGDLVVADHLGKPTSFFAGYRCPTAAETASPCVGEVVHQTALYDLVLTCGLLALLLHLGRRRRSSAVPEAAHTRRYDGFLIFVFGAWYGTGRVVEDFLREDVRRLGLTASQWTSLVTVTVCVVWLLFVRRTPRWGRWDEEPPGREAPDGAEERGLMTEEEPRSPEPDTPEANTMAEPTREE